VTTEDGYILDLWHVWDNSSYNYPAINPATGEKKVAFFQHGLIDIAGTWWFNTENLSVASNLTADGWDLWFGNNRGTTNSYLHKTLTVDDKEYWNYTFTELGKYDVPANVDFVLEHANVSKITYIGHS